MQPFSAFWVYHCSITILKRMKVFSTSVLLLAASLCMFGGSAIAQPTVGKSFELNLTGTSPQFESTDDWKDNIISGTISNPADSVLTLYYSRYQVLPEEWSTSVCFGLSCFPDFLDSATSEFDPHDSRELLLHVTLPAKAQGAGKIYLRIGVVGGRADDTMQVIYEPTAVYTSGVAESAASSVAVFPQPASRGGSLQVSGLTESSKIQIFDLLGKQLSSENIPGGAPIALPSTLVSGTYFLRITANGAVRALPFLVQ